MNNKLISRDEISKILLKIIKTHDTINNRIEFYTIYNSIKACINLNEEQLEEILLIQNDFIKLILWHLNYIKDFNFNILKKKFIYFNPQEQVYIFKRLFYLKHKGKLNFSFNELDDIVRADLDLFLLNEQFDNDFVLDISTHVIIEGIKTFMQKESFMFESDLILKDLKRNNKKKFQIENYFEKCEGRLTAEWNWHSEGKIKKVKFPNNPKKYYFAIEFPAAFPATGENYYGSYTYYEKNPNFEHLKNEVRNLPKRKWNNELKHWGVPANYEKAVYDFAKKHRFFIELEDKRHYDNNIHLVEYSRFKLDEYKKVITDYNNDPIKNIPIGIQFCEGRKAKIPHRKFNREFWWCVNQECYQNSTINHLTEEFEKGINGKIKIWEYYTLMDLLKILNINTDESKTNPMDFIPNGHYYKLLGHINSFNRLLEKLYCQECGELLYPTNTSHFALYRDVRFHCENKHCKEYDNTIYLNHCLNGECNNIIDSRVSNRCKNGLYICNSCGTCCSTNMFERRLDNLRKTGGYIHQDLIDNVDNKAGHLEKKEYYCYKCNGMMTEKSDTLFECNTCKIKYDLSKYKWLDRKWTRKFERRNDYPILQEQNNDDDFNDIQF